MIERGCPNIIKPPFDTIRRCGCKGYQVSSNRVFTMETGYDPAIKLVKCRGCGAEYYLCPKPTEELTTE